ncbi:MAG: hypothetical protein SGPRY_008327 [Prymnesium sp.]
MRAGDSTHLVASGEEVERQSFVAGKLYAAGDKPYASAAAPLHQHAGSASLVHPLVEVDIAQASSGWRHSVFVDVKGNAWACGESANGKLGSPPTSVVQPVPMPIKGLNGCVVVQASCGQHHTAFVTQAGLLYSCGMSLYGQCGHGELRDELSPRQVKALSHVMMAACGDYHTLVLRKDTKVFVFGLGENGRLGIPLNCKSDASSVVERPAQLEVRGAGQTKSTQIVYLSAGGRHSAFVGGDGSVWSCGSGEFGQLGHGLASDELVPRCIQALQDYRMRRISCGEAHTLFVDDNFCVFACGCGGMGRTGLGNRLGSLVPRVIESLVSERVSAGSTHSSFVTENGKVYLCGGDTHGQLGIDGSTSRSKLSPTLLAKFVTEKVNFVQLCPHEASASL